MAVMTGKPAPTEAELEIHEYPEELFSRIMPIIYELEQFQKNVDTPESQERTYWLISEYMRIIHGSAVGEGLPLKNARQLLEELVEAPSDFTSLYGLDLVNKHLQLRQFIYELVAESPRFEIETFLGDIIINRCITAQTQRATGGHLFPDVFLDQGIELNLDTTELLKSGLAQVLADWEQLVNLVYGLVCIKKRVVKDWQNVGKVALLDKVAAMDRATGLDILVDRAWVTVRNSIDHGKAYFDPTVLRIRFVDKNNEVQWDLGDAQREGSDIVLSNHVMLQTFNFVEVAKNSALFTFFEYMEDRLDSSDSNIN